MYNYTHIIESRSTALTAYYHSFDLFSDKSLSSCTGLHLSECGDCNEFDGRSQSGWQQVQDLQHRHAGERRLGKEDIWVSLRLTLFCQWKLTHRKITHRKYNGRITIATKEQCIVDTVNNFIRQ